MKKPPKGKVRLVANKNFRIGFRVCKHGYAPPQGGFKVAYFVKLKPRRHPISTSALIPELVRRIAGNFVQGSGAIYLTLRVYTPEDFLYG